MAEHYNSTKKPETGEYQPLNSLSTNQSLEHLFPPDNVYNRCDTTCQKIRLGFLVFFAWSLSVSISSKIMCNPVATTYLQKELKESFNKTDLIWIEQLYAMITYMLIPLICGLIDNIKLSYRFTLFISFWIMIFGHIGSIWVKNPYYLPLTESVLGGIGSAISFSAIILLIDDCFHDGSKYRVLATTLCQGSVIAAFFICDIYSLLFIYIGWVYEHILVTLLFAVMGAITIVLVPEKGIHPINSRDSSNLQNTIHQTLHWKKKILGVTTRDFKDSPCFLSWLVFRFLVAAINNAIFFMLLKSTTMAEDPVLPLVFGFKSFEMITAFLFSGGQTITYIIGAIVGRCLTNRLLLVYLFSSIVFFFCLVFWQLMQVSGHLLTSLPGQIVVMMLAFMSGGSIGLQDTFAFAASQEATLVSARRGYPFTLIMRGLAAIISPLVIHLFSQLAEIKKSIDVTLGVCAVLSLINFGVIMHCIVSVSARREQAKKASLGEMCLLPNPGTQCRDTIK